MPKGNQKISLSRLHLGGQTATNRFAHEWELDQYVNASHPKCVKNDLVYSTSLSAKRETQRRITDEGIPCGSDSVNQMQ